MMPAPALTNIAPQVTKLLRLLASPIDGEALGAARALKRVLSSASLDLHDLAKVLEFSIRHDARRAAATAHNRSSGLQEAPGAPWQVREMLRYCRDHAIQLSPKEYDFVATLTNRRGPPSERQLEWLCSIYSRLTTEHP